MIIIAAKVTPKSKNSLTEVLEVLGQKVSMRIKVRAIAEDGKANIEVIDAISKYFTIPKNKIKLKSGFTSRNKILIIADEVDLTRIKMQLPLC